MKYLFAIAMFFSGYVSYAQVSPDMIVGKWLAVPNENMIVEVYKVNDEYKGKIAWVKDPNDKSKPIGYEIIDNLTFNPDTESWENGKIYDPQSGKVYSSTAKLENGNSLEVEGYWKFKFLGKTMKFRKVNFNF